MQSNTVNLSRVVDISSGLPLNRKAMENPLLTGEGYTNISYKCITNDGRIDKTLLERFESKEKLDQKYLVQPGDIIMKQMKPYVAICITEEFDKLLIPDNFYILRVKEEERFLPEFLVAFINTPHVQHRIERLSMSAFIPKLLKKDLEILEVPIVDVQRQKQIVNMNSIFSKKERILNEMLNNLFAIRQGINEELFQLKKRR